MAKVRLFGLVLIITTLILGMAVIATETFEIRVHRFTGSPNPVASAEFSSSAGTPINAVGLELEFVTVPIVVPLAFAGGLGLLLWFVPGGSSGIQKKSFSRKRSRRLK